MAKRTRRRRSRRRGFIAIPFSGQLSLGTLATETVVKAQLLGAAPTEDLFVVSVDGVYGLRGMAAGEGPIEIGLNHADLTVTEVKESLEANLLTPDDIIQRERARRPVRRIGMMRGPAVAGEDTVLNGGEVQRTPVRFSVGEAGLELWAKSRDSVANLASGGAVEFSGTLYGRWQR